MLHYHAQLLKARELPLPLINKVIDEKLILRGYTLDSGHLTGLSESIKHTSRPVIKALLLDNCGIDDTELGILL